MRLGIELRSRAGAAQDARREIRTRLGGVLSQTALDDLLTVVSELVSNGVRHGQGEEIRVEIAVDGSRVRGWVENVGRGRIERRPFGEAGGGMGLHIVDALAARWEVSGGDSTRVSFELSAG